MGEYLTVEDVAQRLGVEYKTAYRLVRSGELPAGRVGRVYRVREEDLERYFERQKGLLATQARQAPAGIEGLRCGACARQILSELSIGGRCETTGRPICQACWSIKRIRSCDPQVHTLTQTQPQAQAAPAQAEESLAAAAAPAGQTTPPSAPTAPPAPAPPAEPAETSDQIVARLRAEGRAVLAAGEAKLAEETFLRTFAQRLEQVDSLPEPLSGLTISLRSARAKHEVESAASARKHMPSNAVSRFTLRTGGWGRPKACLALEGRFLCRPDVLETSGYDAEAIDEGELTALLNDLAGGARRSDCFRVVLIGSPTGWTEAAAAIVADPAGSKAFHDRRLAVVLCDLHTDRSILDESDERLWPCWPLVAPRRFAERLAECQRRIREALIDRNSLSLRDARRDLGADEGCLRRAFAELKTTGEFITDELPDIGLVISRL